MDYSRYRLAIMLASVAFLGAGCVTVGGGQPTKSPAKAATPVAKTEEVNLGALSAACTESGGTFLESSHGCLCPTDFYFEPRTNECYGLDGLPGGSRGTAAKKDQKYARDCSESGGSYDAIKDACDCPDGLTFSKRSYECLGPDGTPGGERGQAMRQPTPATTSVTGTGTDTGTSTVSKPSTKPPANAEALQSKCATDARQYLIDFEAAHEKPVAYLYDSYAVTSHYNLSEGKCYAFVSYRPRNGGVSNGGNYLLETSYESLGDVKGMAELANCVYYTNVRYGGASERCYIDSKEYTLTVFRDYVRQRMETK